MKGLELAKAYYETYGRPLLAREFAAAQPRIAAGLCGHGSECFGFDDEISRDHDFEPGFCLWLTDADEREIGFRLTRAYSRLPDTFMGVSIQKKSLLGSGFKGVHAIRHFYSFYIGDRLPETPAEWLQIPDFYLAEATNGEVFDDPLGEFTRIRRALLDRPEDVRLKKLGSCLFSMAQTGQYNYARCLRHGEEAAAAVALGDFCSQAAQAVHLINGVYAPYYKWLFRSLRGLRQLSDCASRLTALLSSPLDERKNAPLIESVCAEIADCLRRQGLVACPDDYLEPCAYQVGEHIRDSALRNSPVML